MDKLCKKIENGVFELGAARGTLEEVGAKVKEALAEKLGSAQGTEQKQEKFPFWSVVIVCLLLINIIFCLHLFTHRNHLRLDVKSISATVLANEAKIRHMHHDQLELINLRLEDIRIREMMQQDITTQTYDIDNVETAIGGIKEDLYWMRQKLGLGEPKRFTPSAPVPGAGRWDIY